MFHRSVSDSNFRIPESEVNNNRNLYNEFSNMNTPLSSDNLHTQIDS